MRKKKKSLEYFSSCLKINRKVKFLPLKIKQQINEATKWKLNDQFPFHGRGPKCPWLSANALFLNRLLEGSLGSRCLIAEQCTAFNLCRRTHRYSLPLFPDRGDIYAVKLANFSTRMYPGAFICFVLNGTTFEPQFLLPPATHPLLPSLYLLGGFS